LVKIPNGVGNAQGVIFMDRVILRPVQPGDFERVLAINEAGWPGVSPLSLAELHMALEVSPYFGVAEYDRHVAGYVITYGAENVYDGDEFGWFKQQFSDFLYIDQIAIARTARRLGLGSRIYHHLEAFARGQGLTSLVCEVNLEPPNPISLNFHSRQQFIEVETMATQDGRRVSLRRRVLAK
jgi:predicted GNAT superfamily acetyltransferase